MRITLAVVFGIAALLVPATASAAPPANDDFANATPIDPSSLPYTASVNNTEATVELGEPLQCIVPSPEKSVWYSFTPSADMVLRADTAGSNFTTFLEVFQSTGPGFGGLQGLQCQFFGNALIFSASAGTTYYFQAAAFPFSAGGDLQFHLQEIPAPPNDDFGAAQAVTSLPHVDNLDTTAADAQAGEPIPSCGFNSVPTGSVWYRLSPSESGSVSARAIGGFSTVLAAYTGNDLGSLTEVGCRNFQGLLTMHVEAGRDYYFQAGGLFGGRGNLQFSIVVTPPPVANMFVSHGDPSIFDTIQFSSASSDPGEVGVESYEWSFGDGGSATGCCPTHRYGADGDYTVTLSVTTFDGRTDSVEQLVRVSTHDVAISKFVVPQSANSGQTKSITVSVANRRYDENVRVELYRSTPAGYVQVGVLNQLVVARSNRSTDFRFSYTFTSDDAVLGKVTFRAIASLLGARDAIPADNDVTSLPTKVNR